ncbi:endoplasmic reticulum membrane-associated RNA degradation protein-like [Episyrphus balteatus]|uniref:endoplasmic reticulum membrane-associated RNA degradation protein-like n=1 Tax=Episyrphus balteatus TaxID=286459 RepID=UPI002485F791|nr:endoplasmic reticulum membrane-associated RNA degradation protein-like [Episyrphus balteatus]
MENNSKSETLLHPKIDELYKIIKCISQSNNLNYIKQNGTFNWQSIAELLFGNGNITKDDPIYPKTYDEYLPYVQLLQPVFQQSHSVLERLTDNTDWLPKLQWLGQQSRLPYILHEYKNPSSETTVVENVLFLTAALEYALGNVYQTIAKKSPPHLLRDLLDTKELRDVLGTCSIFFLKILMGSAESINLRNIVWHGFPLPHEIPPSFVSILLVVSASLSELIEDLSLVSRPQVKNFSRFLTKIHSPPIGYALVDNYLLVTQTVDNSPWTGEWKIYWKQVYQHYEQSNYWRCVMLILPQIELVLRKIYGEANKFDITAKLNEYYITMNSIFEFSEDNRLLDSYMTKGTLHFLYDIFISPFGMRIRDKVSHGEVDLNCLDGKLCSILLYAGLNLLNKNEFPLDGYQSKFHLNSLVYEAVNASKRFVLELMKMRTPSSFGLEFKWNWEVMETLQELVLTECVEIFHRSKKEPEIMMNLMKIAQLIVQICQNYQISFEERFGMFFRHEPRSRARKTLDKMVETLGVIGEILGSIVCYLIRIINERCFENRFDDCQKFCKQTLTIVENLARYSDRESNEWLKALDCCNKFHKIGSDFNSKFK